VKFPAWIEKPLVVDTSIYASGDLVGEKIEIDLSIYRDADELLLRQAMILDKAEQSASFMLILFDADPANTTFVDNDPLNIDDADADKIIGFLSMSLSAGDTGGVDVRNILAQQVMGFPIPLDNAVPKIWVCLMVSAGTTPDYVTANDLILKLGFEARKRKRRK
jgi:hypothetical protein